MANVDKRFPVEVVAAMPRHQELIALTVPVGSTASDAVSLSGLSDRIPEIDVTHAELAVWGRVVPGNAVLKPGDRVEILRPLEKDPREARRAIASEGGFMSGPSGPTGG